MGFSISFKVLWVVSVGATAAKPKKEGISLVRLTSA